MVRWRALQRLQTSSSAPGGARCACECVKARLRRRWQCSAISSRQPATRRDETGPTPPTPTRLADCDTRDTTHKEQVRDIIVPPLCRTTGRASVRRGSSAQSCQPERRLCRRSRLTSTFCHHGVVGTITRWSPRAILTPLVLLVACLSPPVPLVVVVVVVRLPLVSLLPAAAAAAVAVVRRRQS